MPTGKIVNNQYIVGLMKYTLLLFVFFLAFLACKNPVDYTHLQGNALGTTFSVKYQNNVNYSKSIDSLFKVINNSLSTYHPNSIISKINKGDSTIITDFHFEKVFIKAKQIWKQTDGAFDPSVGTLVNAWGFGPKERNEKLDSTTVKELMNYVGFDKMILSNHHIKKQHPKMFIDFNAIAKGYAVDVIAVFLESKKIVNYMVEIGGEMRVRGVNSNQKLWTVGIEKPLTDGRREIETTRTLNNQSMATSGNYRKYRIDKTGKKFVHTIDPKTGFTKQSDIISASVISQLDCADVDAYATAFMVMGFSKTIYFLEKHADLEVVLIYISDKGDIKIFDSKEEKL